MSGESLVTLNVDEGLCIGSGRCEQLEPEVIEVDDDGLARPTGVRLGRSRAQQLCDECPAEAIWIAELESDGVRSEAARGGR
jgi:ferredoxin